MHRQSLTRTGRDLVRLPDHRTSGRDQRIRPLANVAILLAISGLTLQPGLGLAEQSDTVVIRAGAQLHGGVATLQTELTLGAVNGPPDQLFSQIGDLEVRSDGTLIVLENGGPSRMIREFDASGQFIRELGGIGEGPGEFTYPQAMALAPDGRLFVLDRGARTRRMIVYSQAGDPIAHWWPFPAFRGAAGYDPDGLIRFDPSGEIISILINIAAPNAPAFDTFFDEAILRLQPDGTVVDTVKPNLPVPPYLIEPICTRNPNARRPPNAPPAQPNCRPMPYSPRFFWAWHPDGFLVTGRSDRYAIDLRIPSGRLEGNGSYPVWRPTDAVRSIRVSRQVISVSEAERRDRQRLIEDDIRGLPVVSGGINIPAQKPVWKQFRVADDGRIWVSVSTPSREATEGRAEREWREDTLYEIFELDGRFVGKVAVPLGFEIRVIKGDLLWGFSVDEFDVPFISRYKVVWPSS